MIVNTTISTSPDGRENRFWTPQIPRRNFFFPESTESMPLSSQRPTLDEIQMQAERNRAFSMNDLLQSNLPERQKRNNRNQVDNSHFAGPNTSRNYEAIPIYQVDRLALIFNRYEFNQRLVEQHKSKTASNLSGKRKSSSSKAISSPIAAFFRKLKGETPKKDAR